METDRLRRSEGSLPSHLYRPFLDGLITYIRLKNGELQQEQSPVADILIDSIDRASVSAIDAIPIFMATLGIIGKDLKKAPTIADIISGNTTNEYVIEELPLYDIPKIVAREELLEKTEDWFREQFLKHREGIHDPDEESVSLDDFLDDLFGKQ